MHVTSPDSPVLGNWAELRVPYRQAVPLEGSLCGIGNDIAGWRAAPWSLVVYPTRDQLSRQAAPRHACYVPCPTQYARVNVLPDGFEPKSLKQ